MNLVRPADGPLHGIAGWILAVAGVLVAWHGLAPGAAHAWGEPAGGSQSEQPVREVEFSWGVEPIDLSRALSLALSRGYAAQISRLEAAQAGDVADATRGRFLPHLLVDSQAGWSNRINETFISGDGKRYGLDNLGNDPWLDVYLNQVLLDMGTLRRMERERLAEQVASLAEEQVREAVAYEVTRQYADLVRFESLADVARERIDQARWLEAETRHLADAGRVLAVDMEDVAIHLAAAEQRLLALGAEIVAARAVLRESLGAAKAPPGWPRVTAANLPAFAGAVVPSRVEIDKGVRAAPEVRMLELQTRMEDASVAAAKAERLPTLQLRGGYSHYGIKRFDNFEDEAYVFVGMHLPVFDGLQAKSSIRGARKARDVARLRYRSRIGEKGARAEGVAHRVAALDADLALAERRANASQSRLRLADRDLKAQRASVSVALEARERARQNSESAIALRHQRLELWASLQHELGQLAGAIGYPGQSASASGR
jgi:outer membrane protein TolC